MTEKYNKKLFWDFSLLFFGGIGVAGLMIYYVGSGWPPYPDDLRKTVIVVVSGGANVLLVVIALLKVIYDFRSKSEPE